MSTANKKLIREALILFREKEKVIAAYTALGEVLETVSFKGADSDFRRTIETRNMLRRMWNAYDDGLSTLVE
jgi:hypothetical protein